MDPVTLIGLASQAVPALVALFDSDDESTANRAAKAVADVGERLTGQTDPETAAAVIAADPDLYLKFQIDLHKQAAAIFVAETERLRVINRTMRVEATAADPYVRRWRPTFGYAVALSWLAIMGGLAYAIVAQPELVPAIINALVNTSVLWGVALAVLGVSIHQRSEDKKTAAGMRPVGRHVRTARSDRP